MAREDDVEEAVVAAKLLVRLWGGFAQGGVRMVSRTDTSAAQHKYRSASRKFVKTLLAACGGWREASGTCRSRKVPK